ncbi:hypothetical protein [Mesorhizobium sp. M2C.T.Ca.TU.002.02.1.1]|uniref:hypothetical protein n=1 Tax=Mesorhizobium sp. M2C.T.Ca.TU.002.02.1.1 TaxID=2496788 RepID=UPI000FC9B375|nr:hypothetical protein [Mesorhizobium sp. M2C.T.Ca.TU.002.02.1.1]RUU53915.1 hypothetical protein EOD07_22835 [Mesorhizobium sp. M2C.T.Ca.TU.002.02.1.1]RUU71584.1 hypothetical protein EOD04_02160 [Mesorhizobium sp. M2C.T.Ca.TU.009.01.2.1]
MSGIDEGSSEATSFKLAQGKHGYFTSALIDDLTRAEERIKAMHRALEFNNGRPSPGFEKEVIEAEQALEGTDVNIDRLREVCQQLLDVVGDISPEGEKDRASLKVLLDHARVRKNELDDTLSQLDKSLDDTIAQLDNGTFSDFDLAQKASSLMKAGTALSLAEGEWIDFLQKAMRAPSLDPFRAELPRKKAWLEERFKVYEDARAELRSITGDGTK